MSGAGPSALRVVGRGRVGRALAAALDEAFAERRAVSLEPGRALGDRGGEPVEAQRPEAPPETVVLAVPDAVIAETAARLALPTGSVVLHCAGALGVEAYASRAEELRGLELGALHPLISFADPEAPPRVRGAGFAVSGAPRAQAEALAIVAALEGVPLMEVHGPAYHAAAALVANGGAALGYAGVQIMAGLGISPDVGARALGAMLVSVGENLITLGTPEALSGPVRRGDLATVARHRAALGEDAQALAAYDALLPLVVENARSLGLEEETALAMLRLLAED